MEVDDIPDLPASIEPAAEPCDEARATAPSGQQPQLGHGPKHFDEPLMNHVMNSDIGNADVSNENVSDENVSNEDVANKDVSAALLAATNVNSHLVSFD